MAELEEATPERALAVYAHPNDPDVSCGGTMARWAAGGAEVHVVVCTQGDKGSLDPQVDAAELVPRRVEEVAAAAAALGLAGHQFLGYPDGEIENSLEVRGRLVGLIRSLRPEVVLCPDPTAALFGSSYFNHRDHRVVGWSTLDSVAPAAANPHYFPDQGPAHQVDSVYLSGTLQADAWVDITAWIGAKSEALRRHRSQLRDSGEWLDQVVRRRAEEQGQVVGVAYAEGFRILRLGP